MSEIAMLYGWSGSEYVRLPMLWGYGGQYAEHEQDLNTGPADETLTFSTVPAGEVWVITSFCAFATTINPDRVVLLAVIGGASYYLTIAPYGTAFAAVEIAGPIILKKDDYLIAFFSGCGLNDAIYASAIGYKMSIA